MQDIFKILDEPDLIEGTTILKDNEKNAAILNAAIDLFFINQTF